MVRLPESSRSLEGLIDILLGTPRGNPLSRLPPSRTATGPNQISRDDGKRRIVLSANAQGAPCRRSSPTSAAWSPRQAAGRLLRYARWPVQAQGKPSRLVGLLSIVSLVLMFRGALQPLQSVRLSVVIMANIPLALVGAVIGCGYRGSRFSVAALDRLHHPCRHFGAQRHLKVSHYINLMRMEGEVLTTT